MTRQTIKNGKNQNAVRDYIQNGTGSPMPTNKSVYDVVTEKKATYVSTRVYPTNNLSDDLEPATKTITATEKQAISDYNHTNNLPININPMIEFTNIAVKLLVDIDSLSTGAKLNFSIEYPDQTPLTGEFIASGTYKYFVFNVPVTTHLNHAGKRVDIYFWKDTDGIGDTVISQVRLYTAFGVCGSDPRIFAKINTSGLVQISGKLNNYNGASATINFGTYSGLTNGAVYATGVASGTLLGCVPNNTIYINHGEKNRLALCGVGATDIVIISDFTVSVCQP
jgi:hypothetical protein